MPHVGHRLLLTDAVLVLLVAMKVPPVLDWLERGRLLPQVVSFTIQRSNCPASIRSVPPDLVVLIKHALKTVRNVCLGQLEIHSCLFQLPIQFRLDLFLLPEFKILGIAFQFRVGRDQSG